MVKPIKTLEDLQNFLKRGAGLCLWLFILLFFVGIPFVIVPDLGNVKGTVQTSIVLQSYIVVYGLMLAFSAATATLSANHAREVVTDLRTMRPIHKGDINGLEEAIKTAEGLRRDLFINEVFVMVVSLAGIVMVVFLILLYGGGLITPLAFVYPLGVLFLAFSGLLLLVSHTVLISSISLVPPPVPPKPCPKCGGPLSYIKYYESDYCTACGAYR